MSSESSATPIPAYVLRHLATVAAAEGLRDYTIESSAGSKNGDGFMSNMLAVTLTAAAGAGRRLSLICKLQLPQATEGSLMSLVFVREVAMYGRIMPLLAELQRAHGLCEATGFFAYPRCYLAECAANNESIIILEDLRERHFALHGKLAPMHYEQVALLLTQLARYNALSFVLRDQRPEVFAELEALDDLLPDGLSDSKMACIFASGIEEGLVRLDAEKDKQLMRKFRDIWMSKLLTRRQPERLKRFGVLSHGDCHTNNMMFRWGADGVADAIVLIDWQVSTVCSPVTDLANFMFWCADKELRDKHYEGLLRLYHDELQRVIRACGSDADALFSYADLEDQLQEFAINALVMAPAAVTFMVTDSEDMKSMADISADGDLNDQSLAPITKRTEQRFKDRLLDILADGRRLGYLREYE